ncbi:signal peptidase II, partial [bacterium]|nr:signal peptidase II [bacterium]
MRNNKEKSIVYRMLLTFTVALSLDSLSKAWVEQTLILHHPVSVIGDLFRFTLSYNTGVAFSVFEGGGSVRL